MSPFTGTVLASGLISYRYGTSVMAAKILLKFRLIDLSCIDAVLLACVAGDVIVFSLLFSKWVTYIFRFSSSGMILLARSIFTELGVDNGMFESSSR